MKGKGMEFSKVSNPAKQNCSSVLTESLSISSEEALGWLYVRMKLSLCLQGSKKLHRDLDFLTPTVIFPLAQEIHRSLLPSISEELFNFLKNNPKHLPF